MGECGVLKEKSVLDPKKHYFWLDRRLAYLAPEALSKKGFLLYLLYARSCNPKWLNCSMASYEAAREAVGLPRLAVDSAREELVQKGFIKLRPDVKPGRFKTTPVEVLPFPSPDNSIDKPGEGRCLKKTTEPVMFLPSCLVDGKFLKGLSLFELRTLLFLYAHCRLAECLGVDFQIVHAWNRDYRQGVKKTIKRWGEESPSWRAGKEYLEVAEPKQWWVSEEMCSVLGSGVYQALNSLLDRTLITLEPVVIWQDPEDSDIGEARRDCFVSFGENGEKGFRWIYWIYGLEAGERVVWVVMPKLLAENSEYKAFVKRWEEETQGVFEVDSYKGEVGGVVQ